MPSEHHRHSSPIITQCHQSTTRTVHVRIRTQTSKTTTYYTIPIIWLVNIASLLKLNYKHKRLDLDLWYTATGMWWRLNILNKYRQGGCLACCGCKFDSRRGCTDLYYARGTQGVLPMRVVGVGTTSQLDPPSLTPLSVAGFVRLQLGVTNWAASVTSLQLVDNWPPPTFCGSRFSTGRLLAIEDVTIHTCHFPLSIASEQETWLGNNLINQILWVIRSFLAKTFGKRILFM